MHRILFLLILSSAKCVNCQDSAQYLQNAVRDLRRLNYRQTLRRADTAMAQSAPRQHTPLQMAERKVQHGHGVAPALSLTKGELVALYENAISKGDTLKLDTGENSYVHTAVHELGDHDHYDHDHYDHEDHPDHPDHHDEKDLPPHNDKSKDGYYYYYYPLKSFMDDITDGSSSDTKPWVHKTTTQLPPYQYHSHHHEVTIKKEKEKEMNNDKKGLLEPLFMAISGFVGMALMVVVSMIILPKFGSKPKKTLFWKNNSEMDELARLALNAIEGKDCRERFACELSKTARNFHLQDNRFIKLLKRIAPGTFGSQIDRIGKYGDRQLKCTLIPCTKKIITIKKVTPKKPPVKKKNIAQKKH